jgi:hypothetical protein
MDDPTVNTSGRLNQNLNNRMELKRIPLDYILLKYVYIKNVQKKKNTERVTNIRKSSQETTKQEHIQWANIKLMFSTPLLQKQPPGTVIMRELDK